MKSKLIEIPGVETVGIEIRSYNGVDCLFTTDGKLISNQIEGSVFTWYVRHSRDRSEDEKSIRATLSIDDVNVKQGPPV